LKTAEKRAKSALKWVKMGKNSIRSKTAISREKKKKKLLKYGEKKAKMDRK
jgi:hypothetical protein